METDCNNLKTHVRVCAFDRNIHPGSWQGRMTIMSYHVSSVAEPKFYVTQRYSTTEYLARLAFVHVHAAIVVHVCRCLLVAR